MQAYRVKGKVDQSGQLIITESIDLSPGEVEVIVLQSALSSTTLASSASRSSAVEQPECEIPGLKQWLEETPKVSADFNPDQAKWDYLQEKHSL